MFLAPIKYICHIALFLPVVAKDFLKTERIAKFADLLKLVNTDNDFSQAWT